MGAGLSTQAYLDQATSNADGVACGMPEKTAQPDLASVLSSVEEAADYDRWFRAKVQASLDGLKDGSNRVLSDDEVTAGRAALQAKVLAIQTKASA